VIHLIRQAGAFVLRSLHEARERIRWIQRPRTEGDRVADARGEGAGDRAAAPVLTSSSVQPALSGDGEGGSGRCVPADALGDGERSGRTVRAGDRGGTRGAASEGLQAAYQAGAVAAGAAKIIVISSFILFEVGCCVKLRKTSAASAPTSEARPQGATCLIKLESQIPYLPSIFSPPIEPSRTQICAQSTPLSPIQH